MYVKKLFQFLTLRSALVSAHRKRQFVLTSTLLVAVLFFRAFSVALVTHLPYAVKVIDVITYTLIINVTINALRIFIVSSHRQRREISNEEHDNFTVGVNAIVNAATVLAVIVFIFIVFDIEVRSFLSSMAIFAVALTIIFQDFIKNFLFGFAIMFSADYEIGDYIQVGSMPKGVIRNINFSSVQIKTEGGDVLYIPNAVVHSSEITNFSKLKPKRINAEFILLRSQLTTVAVFEKQLLAYLEKTYPATFEVEKCHVHVKEGNKDEIIFTLEASTKKASLKLKEQVNHTVQRFAVEFGR
jgi:small-conductance mechanosensitive channel